jgi:hypothetical protein
MSPRLRNPEGGCSQMAIDNEVRPAPAQSPLGKPAHEPHEPATPDGVENLVRRLVGSAERAIAASQHRARKFITTEVREARSRSKSQVKKLYGNSPAYEHHRRVVLAKAARMETRRAAPAIAAFRCAIAACACFTVELTFWNHQHAFYEALGLLGLGACVIISMVLLMQALPIRFVEKWGFALAIAGCGALILVMAGQVSICEFYFPNFGHHNWRTVHFTAGPPGLIPETFGPLFAVLAALCVGVALATAHAQRPTKHSPLDETFFALITAACKLKTMRHGRKWADDQLARDVQEQLEWAANAAEKAFTGRGTPRARNNSTRSAGRLLACRIRAYKVPIATATSRRTCMDVYDAILADINTWINDEPVALEGSEQDAVKPPRLQKLRRALPTVLRSTVLVVAGFLVPLLPGVASSTSAVESTRVALWTAAALSITVGGISPSDQIMGFLRGGGDSKQ